MRVLSLADHQALAVFASDLELEARARTLDEERLELLLSRPQPEVVTDNVYALPGGMSRAHRQWILREVAPRSRAHVETLRTMYRGRCQICAWESRATHDVDVCEGHHVQWLSRGGGDALGNMVLLCPNHHRLVHALDAPLDFCDLTFDLGDRRESLRLNEHLHRATPPSTAMPL